MFIQFTAQNVTSFNDSKAEKAHLPGSDVTINSLLLFDIEQPLFLHPIVDKCKMQSLLPNELGSFILFSARIQCFKN